MSLVCLAFLLLMGLAGGKSESAGISPTAGAAEQFVLDILNCRDPRLAVEPAVRTAMALADPNATANTVSTEARTPRGGASALACKPLGVERVRHSSVTPDDGTQEIHTVDVFSVDGRVLRATLILRIQPDGVPVLASAMSLAPAAVSKAEDSDSPSVRIPAGFDETKVANRLVEWSTAFLANDSSRMPDITDQRHTETIGSGWDDPFAELIGAVPVRATKESVTLRTTIRTRSGLTLAWDVEVDRLGEINPSVASWTPIGAAT